MSKVFIVSDQPVLMGGLQHVLGDHGFEVAATLDNSSAAPAAEAVTNPATAPPPDLVLMDITAGLGFTDLIGLSAQWPGCPVVLWADPMPLDMVFRALEFGVRGIVERSSSAEHLADALRRVAGGEMQIGFAAGSDAALPHRRVALTPREREIVTFLRQGLRNKQIAAEMNITEGTVKIYLFRLFQKLGVRNRFELAQSNALDQLPAPPARTAGGGGSQTPGRVSAAARRFAAEHHGVRLI